MFCPSCGTMLAQGVTRCDCGKAIGTPAALRDYANPGFGPLASLSERIVAQIMDSLIAIAAIVGGFSLSAISDTMGLIGGFAGVGFAAFYLLFADGFRGGQSYGKRLMGTAVVDAATGAPCTYGQSFGRNILLSILGVIDWVFIFGGRRHGWAIEPPARSS